MIKDQDMELALGLPVEISSFVDGIPRLCYPYKLKDLRKLTWYLTFIDTENLEKTISIKESAIALISLLKESFPDYDEQDILSNITADNYNEILSDIKQISGLSSFDDCNDDNNGESLSWKKSISIIQVYTSNTIKDICEMTLNNYRSLLSAIGFKLNWDYKIETITSVKEPNNYIDKSEHPLASDIINTTKRYMTMSDVQNLKDMGGK